MIAIWAIKITAIGNRVYTDKTRLRGLKTFLVRGGGHCLCSREFYSPGLFGCTIITKNNYNCNNQNHKIK